MVELEDDHLAAGLLHRLVWELTETALRRLAPPGGEARRAACAACAACAAGAVEPSHVLRGRGLPMDRIQGSLRFSLGRTTTAVQIDRAAAAVAEAVERQRKVARAHAGRGA